MKTIAKILAALCAILFVITTILALLLFNLERRAFDAETYKQALLKQDIYERMPSVLGEMLTASVSYNPCATNPVACGAENRSPQAQACIESAVGQEAYQALVRNERAPTADELQRTQSCLKQFPSQAADDQEKNGPPPFIKNLTAEEWTTILQALLPPEEMRSMTESALEGIFAYFNGEADAASLSLTGLKARLAGPAGAEAALSLLRSQPPCTLEQVAKMTAASISAGSEIELCSPPEEVIPVIQPFIELELQTAAAAIPDRVTLIQTPPPEAALAGVTDPRQSLGRVRMIMRLSPLIPLAFLLGITIFAVRSFRGWLKWWGWPLLIAGVLGAILGWASTPTFRIFFTRFLASRLPAYLPAMIAQTGSNLAGAVLRQLLKPIGWEGLLLAAVGLAMILVAAYTLKREQRIAASEAQTEVPQ